MRKPGWSALLIIGTALGCALIAVLPQSRAVQARIVTVERGDVHQLVPLTGYVAFAEERYAYAATDGLVSRICVEEGQRVAAGEALVRLENASLEALAAVGATMNDPYGQIADRFALEDSVIRAEKSCTVRQLLIGEHMPVAAGTPIARLSSNQEEIICKAMEADAVQLETGMWAWLYVKGERCGAAEITSISETQIDASTGLAAAQVVLIPEATLNLAEGTAVDVDVYLAGSDNVLRLPIEAVTDRETVWWVNEGRCTEIPANIVLFDEMYCWVHLPEGLPVAIGEFCEGQLVEARE